MYLYYNHVKLLHFPNKVTILLTLEGIRVLAKQHGIIRHYVKQLGENGNSPTNQLFNTDHKTQ